MFGLSAAAVGCSSARDAEEPRHAGSTCPDDVARVGAYDCGGLTVRVVEGTDHPALPGIVKHQLATTLGEEATPTSYYALSGSHQGIAHRGVLARAQTGHAAGWALALELQSQTRQASLRCSRVADSADSLSSRLPMDLARCHAIGLGVVLGAAVPVPRSSTASECEALGAHLASGDNLLGGVIIEAACRSDGFPITTVRCLKTSKPLDACWSPLLEGRQILPFDPPSPE